MYRSIADQVEIFAKQLDPVPSVTQIHRSREAHWNQHLQHSKNRQKGDSLYHIRVEKIIKGEDNYKIDYNQPVRLTVRRRSRIILPMQKHTRERKKPSNEENIPRVAPPANGSVYTAEEAVSKSSSIDIRKKWTIW